MKVFLIAFFCISLGLHSTTIAKELPSTVDFMNIFTSCGMGSNINLEGNLKGSIEDVYQKGRIEGKASQQIMSDIIRLIPENQRAAVYEKYLNCVDKRLGQIDFYNKKKYKVGFLPGSYWVGNADIGDVKGSISTIDFLVDGTPASAAHLDEMTEEFDVFLQRGHHVLTMVTDVSTDLGRRTRDRCSISFDIEGDCFFTFEIKFGPFEASRDRVESCRLRPT